MRGGGEFQFREYPQSGTKAKDVKEERKKSENHPEKYCFTAFISHLEKMFFFVCWYTILAGQHRTLGSYVTLNS